MSRERNGQQLLHFSSLGNASAVTKLLASSTVNVDVRDLDGNTALMLASAGGHEHVLLSLLKRGAAVDTRNLLGSTALMQACRNGHLAAVKLLVQNKASVFSCNAMGASPLTLAADRGYVSVVEALLDAGADVNGYASERSRRGQGGFLSPLHLSARHGHGEVVSLLLERGADVDARIGETGWTPLMVSAVFGKINVCQLLLSKQADVEVTNALGNTALDLAIDCGQSKVERLLRSKIPSEPDPMVWSTDSMDIFNAAKTGSTNRIRSILELDRQQACMKDKDGATPLIFAAMRGHQLAVELLVSAGTDVNAQDSISGWSALMQATYYGHKLVAGFLIEHGANVNLQAKDGCTAFDMATLLGDTVLVRLLAAHSMQYPKKGEQVRKTPKSRSPWSAPADVHPSSGFALNGHVHGCQTENPLSEHGSTGNSGLKRLFSQISVKLRRRPSKVSVPASHTRKPSLQQQPESTSPRSPLSDDSSGSATPTDPFGEQPEGYSPSPPHPLKPHTPLFGAPVATVPTEVMVAIVPPFKPSAAFDLVESRDGDTGAHSGRRFNRRPPRSISNSSGVSTGSQRSGGMIRPSRGTLGSISSISSSSSLQTPHLPNETSSSLGLPHSMPDSDTSSGLPSPSAHGSFLSFLPQPPTHRSIRTSSQSSRLPRSVPPRMQSNASVLSPQRRGSVVSAASEASTDTASTISVERNLSTEGDDEVGGLLRRLSLEKYQPIFEEQEVDMEAFLSLTDNDLKELGITTFGPRNQILSAIKQLSNNKITNGE